METSSGQSREAIGSDEQLLDVWLYGRSPHTDRAYRGDIQALLSSIGKPVGDLTIVDLQTFARSLVDLAPATQYRRLAAIKSMMRFGRHVGYLQADPGAELVLPKLKDDLAERILTEADVHMLVALETNVRNKILLKVMYSSGCRVSEVCGLKWRDVQPRGEVGQITLFGKRSKTRVVKLSAKTWTDLQALRGSAGMDDPVFRSRKFGGHLTPTQVARIVRAAAVRAAIQGKVSPHWLRHSHASHALDRGCPIHLIQATLGHHSIATTGRYLHARPEDSSSSYVAM